MLLSRRELHKLALGGGAALGLGMPAIPSLAGEGGILNVPLGGTPKEPLGGQPAVGTQPSFDDLEHQVKYHRAFEAILWAMPAVSIYRFRAAAFESLGYQDNDIIAYSDTLRPLGEATTANASTPYIVAFSDLQDGPAVLELPAAGNDGSLYGQVVDAWQYTIADVGPQGLDQGKGGKYLFTPPGYNEEIPEGYIHVPSPNYRIALAFRSVRGPGMTARDAYNYALRMRMYRLSEADNPPKQEFLDPLDERYPTLPFYDERHFEDIHAIVSVEPVKTEDKHMMGMLTSLGIQVGKEYKPDGATLMAMKQASVDAWYYLQNWYDHFPKEQLFWEDRHYASLLQADDNNRFDWTYEDRIDIIPRAAEYFWCTYMPKELNVTPETQYLMALADKNGDLLKPGETYKLVVPAEMPVKQFWALTVYDRATMSFIYSESERTTLSSYDIPDMRVNKDGSVTIFMGPTAPQGYEANWIPTSGKRPLPAMRLYGPTDEINEKRFKLNDVELVS